MMPPHPVHRLSYFLPLSGFLLLGVLLAVSEAQVLSAITPDGTLGTVITPDGRVFNITGGTRPDQGPNLFHSFGQFDVGTGDTAHFVGQAGIDNIIGRITGGSESLIDGRLQSDASLFLLNPSGLMFGPNATLDVNGSFHASTADVLRFADGTAFSAHLNEKSTFTVAAPSAFGFLNENPADISIQGSRLQVAEGEKLSIVGGDIEIVGDRNDFLNDPANLAAPSGQINLASVGSAGEVVLEAAGDTPALNVNSFAALGTIEIKQHALIDTSGNGGGTVVIRGSRLQIDNSHISANTVGDVDAADRSIDLQLANDIVLTNEAMITTDVLGTGNAGDIRIATDGLDMAGDSVIRSQTLAGGDASAIGVETASAMLTDGSQIYSNTSGLGSGGTVTVTASESISIRGHDSEGNASGLFSNSFGDGDAGRVIVFAPTFELIGGQLQVASTGAGNAGVIEVNVGQSVLTEGGLIQALAIGEGEAGTISVEADQLTLSGGAQLDSRSLSAREGGRINVTATNAITLDEASKIDASGGGGGTVAVRSNSLRMHQASIVADTSGDLNGAEVGIDITSESVYLDRSTIETTSFGQGNAGNILLNVGTLDLTVGGVIDSTAAGTGRGGDVLVTASQGVTIKGTNTFSNPFDLARLSAGTRGPGNAGRVIISAPALTLQGFASISTSTFGEGNAGSIEIEVDSLSLSEGAGIFNSTSGTGPGGTTTVTARESLSIQDGGIVMNALDRGNAGQVTISTPNLLMDGGRIQAIGQEDSTGDAGVIRIEADQISLTGSAQIDSSTDGAGRGGDIMVISDDIRISDTSSTGMQSGFFSEATSHGDAGSLTISTSTLTMDGGVIRARTIGEGNAGAIEVHAGRISLTGGAQLDSTTSSTGQGGTITVTATDRMDIRGVNDDSIASGLSSISVGRGAAGRISVSTASLDLKEGGMILAATAGEGRAGSIEVNAEKISVTNKAQINSSTLGGGPGGAVMLTAEEIQLAQNGNINVTGGGGGVVMVRGDRLMIDNALINASTFGDIDGGGIDIHLTGDLAMSKPGGILAPVFGNGRGGDIFVEARSITLTEGAEINSTTRDGTGQGGNLTVIARDAVTISGHASGPSPILSGLAANTLGAGHAGRLSVSTPVLNIDDGIIQALTLGDGNAGDIRVEVGRLTLTGGAQISSSSGATNISTGELGRGSGQGGNLTVIATEGISISGERDGFPSALLTETSGRGNAGSISIFTPILTMEDGLISSATIGDGNAGDLMIDVGRLTIVGGAQIASASGNNAGDVGRGQGGEMTITAADEIFISGLSSGIFSNTFGSGAAGNIDITASALRMDNEGAIEADGAGGRAGDINIGAGNIFLTNSTVTAEASQADGGNITLTAPSLLRLRDSTIAATVSGGPETIGGNITIDPEFVILENSHILSNANQGRGGDINIEAGVFLADPTSLISALALNSEVGIDGEVNVEAVATNLSDVVTPLTPDFTAAAELLRDRCAAQLQEGTVSSLVDRGRTSVPATPEGLLPSRLYQPSPTSALSPDIERQSGKTDVPQQGMLAEDQWGRPQIISRSFLTHSPIALKCRWTKP